LPGRIQSKITISPIIAEVGSAKAKPHEMKASITPKKDYADTGESGWEESVVALK
jgi:hypothetical protein